MQRIEYNISLIAERMSISPPLNPIAIEINLRDLYCGTSLKFDMHRWLCCPACSTEATPTYACASCNGCGVQPKNTTIAFSVPKGSHPGDRIVIQGQGHMMRHNDAPDNLMIELVASKDNIFKLINNDLHVTYAVTSNQALQGFLLNITHLDNHIVKLSFSPCEVTLKQNTFTIKNEGFPISKSSTSAKKQQYGDLIVKFKVDVDASESSTLPRSTLLFSQDNDRKRVQCYASGSPCPLGQRNMYQFPTGVWYKWSCCNSQAKDPLHHR